MKTTAKTIHAAVIHSNGLELLPPPLFFPVKLIEAAELDHKSYVF